MLSSRCVRLFVTPRTVAPRLLYPQGFRQESWSGLPCPSPGDLPIPGIKPRSPALQVDFLPSELRGKLKNTGVGSLSLLQRIFLTQESNWKSLALQADSLPAELPGKSCCRYPFSKVFFSSLEKFIMTALKSASGNSNLQVPSEIISVVCLFPPDGLHVLLSLLSYKFFGWKPDILDNIR